MWNQAKKIKRTHVLRQQCGDCGGWGGDGREYQKDKWQWKKHNKNKLLKVYNWKKISCK